jgi:hypothetical protein|tara:strand:+ start:192 stop:605 length:414 start_codon:yes stop_codon:yes gene_type:complete
MAGTNPGYGVGLRNVGSYQISGHPYLTGTADMGSADTEHKISFPYVTKTVTVVNSGSADKEIKVHFNSDSDPGEVLDSRHYISLNSNEDSFTFDVKCKEIYITNSVANAGFMLYASLTSIPTSSMYALTGSGLTEIP